MASSPIFLFENGVIIVSTPWFYPDKVSAYPSESVSIHASGPEIPCIFTISRIGREKVEVEKFETPPLINYSIPNNADSEGCDWPVAFRFTVKKEWKSGYYDLKMEAPNGEVSHHFICVKKAQTVKKAKAVIILTTNTYAAYNYWGGANSYAHVEKLKSGALSPEDARAQAIGRLSRMRPLAQGMFNPPEDAPRVINPQPRGKNEMPIPGDLKWIMTHQPSPYDGSAGFLNKWEHRFAIWAESQGIELDYLTDHDLEGGASILAGYKTVLLIGHSEYWSANGRAAIDHFVQDGGGLAVFSGNTCYWKVRWEDGGQTLITHKWNGELNDPKWNDEKTRADATHLWSHPAFSNPEASTFGLSFFYGGYHRAAMCVARGSAAYTVYNDTHWALEGTDLYYGDLIGAGVPLIGYENDGCPISFGEDGLPVNSGGLGVPDNLEIIAIAPATLAESPRSPFPPMIPPEHPKVLAKIAYGDDQKSVERLMRGHAVMASFKLGEGEVFNAGTTEWVHGLASGDPFVEGITLNVLTRFGI